NCDGWEINDNTINDVAWGISTVGGAHADIWSNSISDASSGAFYIEAHGVIELWENIITDSYVGLDITSAGDAYIRDNTITGGETGIHLESLVSGAFHSNIISDCESNGFDLNDVSIVEFTGNNISRCGIAGVNFESSWHNYFEDNNLINCGFYLIGNALDMQLYNQTFSGNLVNGKPLYFAFNETGLSIDGDLYGEVILGACNDSTITGGDFNHSTGAILLYLSHRNDISGVHISEEMIGVHFWESHNNTLRDSTLESCDTYTTVWIADSLRCVVDNCEIKNIDGAGIFIDNATYTTVQNSDFQDISGDAVAVEFPDSVDPTYAQIYNNDFVNTSVGVNGYYYSTTMNITYNDFMWCEVGIATLYADYSHFAYNYFHDNEWGMLLEDTWAVSVYNNTYFWNNIGLELYGDVSISIYYNIFGPNFLFGGYDDGSNLWDDNVDTGNWWYDFAGTVPYPIDGGSSEDRYPMAYKAPTEPIINTPEDISFPEGSTGNEILWMPFDDSLRDWVVTVDDDTWDSGIWNFDNITVNLDALPYGDYEVNITVWDVDLNTVSDTVYLVVYDDTPPEIDAPANAEFYVDADGQTLEWLVSDLNPTTYTVTIGIMEYDSGTWTAGTLVIDADDIAEGEHEVQLTIFDIDGNSASANVTVLVILDDDAPSINSPEDRIYIEGTTRNIIEWAPSDDHPDYYEVSFNETTVSSASWGGSRITYNVDGLSPGTYEFQLTVYDKSGLSANDIVNVTVIPLQFTPPTEPLDWGTIILVGGVIAIIVVVVGITYYIRKKKTTSS
ncbi:MAG: NosD domain-containing protein, partial [Candidatus Thorarchaeota archaeon]|nr:NosD domain-containing protein [Candidatus Thorarchaeota archaeon]